MKKLVEKSIYARFMSWFLVNKKIIFIVLGVLFWLVAIVGLYNNIVWGWDWAELFISLIMFVFGFLFFPFSFSWQKQIFGASLYTIGFLKVLMFFVFIGLTFNIIQDIIQGDFIFTIWSILSVILILFWWLIIIPKTSLLLTKYIGIKFSILWAKGIFFFFVVIFFADIIGITSSGSKIDYKENTFVCFGSELKLHSDDRIDAYITTSDILSSQEGKIDATVFPIEDIKSLFYRIDGSSDNNQYYFNREICNLDEQTPVAFLLSDGGLLVEEMYPGAVGGTSSNISPFSNINLVSGNYALNVFVSDDNESWELVKTLTFEVK